MRGRITAMNGMDLWAGQRLRIDTEEEQGMCFVVETIAYEKDDNGFIFGAARLKREDGDEVITIMAIPNEVTSERD